MPDRRRRSAAAAVVLNWNGWPFTSRCLQDLASSTLPIDVIAVDNGSTDGSGDLLAAQEGPGVQIVRLPRNRGFTGGMNAGLRLAASSGYDYVWLLNNDVSFPADTHGMLLAALAGQPCETVLTPVLRGPTGIEQHVGGLYVCDGSHPRLQTSGTFAAVPNDRAWLTATALFCRLSTAERIGPFEESFFMYWEDVDWSFRATRLGIRLAVAADATITHYGAQGGGAFGSPLAAFLMARNELLFLRRHAPDGSRWPVTARVVARQLRWAKLLDRRGQHGAARALLGGLLDGLLRSDGAPHHISLLGFLAYPLLARPLSIARWLEKWASAAPPAPSTTPPA